IVTVFFMACSMASAAFYYKSYIVRYDRGWNILCEPYIVKKDDWIFKLFRQKGEISHRDFPEFLGIFKRLNPHISDMDHIRPGQRIVIPLKKVDDDTFSESSSGVVTIPFFSATDISEAKTKPSIDYRVKTGDCVSILISERYGKYGTESYRAGEQLFRKLNPQIENLNLIYAGQMIRLPEPEMKNTSLSPSPDDGAAVHEKTNLSGSTAVAGEKTSPASVLKVDEKPSDSLLSNVASILDAKLFNRGSYYLPRRGQEDFKLDLSQTPFIKLEDGTRIFFIMGADNQKPEMTILKSFWKDVYAVNIDSGDSTEHILDSVFGELETGGFKQKLNFSDQGVDVEVRGKWIIEKPSEEGEPTRHLCITLIHSSKEETPASIVRYLDQNNIIIKDIILGKSAPEPKTKVFRLINTRGPVDIKTNSGHQAFVRDFLVAMGYQYIADKQISFQYAGIPIDAASNLASDNNGNTFFIDFGTFYGDAFQAIEKSGYSIIQVKDTDTLDNIIQKLLGAMDVSFTKNPTFLAAKRPAVDNTKLTIPGFLTDYQNAPQTLIALAPLPHRVIQYLTDNNIRIIQINFQGKKNE
ncbi:MAG: LysM peptidoglycan-binding domain-containing protein, partial [Desulfobacterales bacterium]